MAQLDHREYKLLPSLLRTATLTTLDQENVNAPGVLVYLDVSAASGTGGLTVTIQGKDPISGNYVDLNAAPAAVIATGTKTYELYPDANAGGVTQATSGVLPRTWRLKVAHGDATNYTYSVAAVTLV